VSGFEPNLPLCGFDPPIAEHDLPALVLRPGLIEGGKQITPPDNVPDRLLDIVHPVAEVWEGNAALRFKTAQAVSLFDFVRF